MKIKGNRFVTSILAASMLSGTFFVPASAGELEGESAIAGMAVTLNNYYAGEETPDEAILDYLVPKARLLYTSDVYKRQLFTTVKSARRLSSEDSAAT